MTPVPQRTMTLHPQGKEGVNIETDKYESMRRALLKVIPGRTASVPFKSLAKLVEPHLDPVAFPPQASRVWYVTAVKQDLEARGLIEQVPGLRPQHMRRAGGGKS